MHRSLQIVIIGIVFFIPSNLVGSDTIVLNGTEKKVDLSGQFHVLEDPEDTLAAEFVIENFDTLGFKVHNKNHMNFEFSTSTYWVLFHIKNQSNKPIDYRLEVSNPDLNHVSFYKFNEDSIYKSVNTGELHDVRTREIAHRNFLFKVNVGPKEASSFLCAFNNNGHPFYVPLTLTEQKYYEAFDYKTEILNWISYGILVFILIFHGYLYRSTKDKVNIYYSLSLLFSIIYFLHYEGYFFFFNPPVFIEKIKWITPSLYIVFLLTFSQSFINYSNRLKKLKKYITPFKYFAIVGIFFYSFGYPLSLISDIGLSLLILATYLFIIIVAIITLKKNYPPSKIFLLAYCFAFGAMVINQMKELGTVQSSFVVVNAVKIGLTVQNILLTIAVLERFRINQDNAKKTIEDNYEKIELQNKELEIINTELEKLSIVASETNNGIAIYNTNGALEWCNTRFEDYYGVNLVELIGSKKDKIEEIVPNKMISKNFEWCLKHEKSINFETLVQSRGNKKIWVQTTLSPFKRSGEVQKLISIDSDISNLKKFEHKLQQAKENAEEADRLKTVFLGNMSHEIRTPLNGIIGFSDLLFGSAMDEEKQKKYLLLIKNNGEQLMNIIEDIVDISLIESNQMRVNPKKTDLHQVFKETAAFFENFRTSFDKNHIALKLDIDLPPNQSTIVTDAFRLKQVLNNLLKNAFKFTEEGYVQLGCKLEHENILIYVEDTGIGVDPDLKEQIFLRFRQGEETLTRKYGGNGLGLAISKGIVEKLGGDIWLDTKYTKGARFCFNIPFLEPGNDQTVSGAGTGAKNPKVTDKSFLIVEDHDSSYEFLEEVLRPFNTIVSRASDGKQAVEMVRENTYDMILMDISLPEQDGLTAVKEIRKFNTAVPIIAQTAHAMLSQKEEILQQGFNDIITKPINKQLLFQKINPFF